MNAGSYNLLIALARVQYVSWQVRTNLLRSCIVAFAFFNIGLSCTLLVEGSSSCFLGVRGGRSTTVYTYKQGKRDSKYDAHPRWLRPTRHCRRPRQQEDQTSPPPHRDGVRHICPRLRQSPLPGNSRLRTVVVREKDKAAYRIALDEIRHVVVKAERLFC